MTLDLTTWRLARIDQDDPDSYVTLQWPGLKALWKTAPAEDLADLTWGDYQAYLARAIAITAAAYALMLGQPHEHRPYLHQVEVELEDEEGPNITAQIPLKAFRDIVESAVQIIDSRKAEPDEPVREAVLEGREYERQVREITQRVGRLLPKGDSETRSWVWGNLGPLGYEGKKRWLDDFEERVATERASILAQRLLDQEAASA